ncbi:transporter substrate-binding domain-containing protein [Pigmentibacter sp. JX0631]|uniref:substrate-binding periplasmic protein n=1 Tax=Pigmentibacter sp. JX0631 TaxID=2976982 RepID=UPI0024689E47|nr:transporter substrate-binding domain-containing protein [Pigmentibacter sp. JX0631]WGL58881.1 transporter substrate-binding domain-containing protein [Pigmentibacter sp. JX0631]
MLYLFKRLDLIKQVQNSNRTIFFLYIVALFVSLPCQIFAKEKITLLTPPSPGEFYFEVAQEVFKIGKLNIKTQVEAYPSIYKKMNSTTEESREVYATIAVLNDSNSKKYHNVFNIISIETSFFTLKENKKKSETVDEVKNLKKVCVWLDSVLNKYLINQGFQNLFPVPTLNQCITMLFNGEVDALYSSEAPLIKSTKVLGQDLRKLKKGYTPMRVTFFLAVTKNASNEIIKNLTNSGKLLKSSGKYDQILDKYRKDLYLP